MIAKNRAHREGQAEDIDQSNSDMELECASRDEKSKMEHERDCRECKKKRRLNARVWKTK